MITGKAISTIGYRGMHSYDVFFDNWFVPDENLLGGPDGKVGASISPWQVLPVAAFRPQHARSD